MESSCAPNNVDLNVASNRLRDRILLLFGPLCFILVLAFVAGGGFLPPIAPTASLDEVAKHYREYRAGIEVGSLLLRLASVIWPLYAVGLHNQLSRIPRVSTSAILLQIAGGCVFGLVFGMIAAFVSAAAYRPEREPALIQLASDLNWLWYNSSSGPLTVQSIGVSWAILSDTGPKPRIPRWVAWVNMLLPLWCLLEFGVHFFHGGPMGWNGGVVFWGAWGAGLVSW